MLLRECPTHNKQWCYLLSQHFLRLCVGMLPLNKGAHSQQDKLSELQRVGMAQQRRTQRRHRLEGFPDMALGLLQLFCVATQEPQTDTNS